VAEDPSQIREAIEETRLEIAETMEALGRKADIKSRLTESVKEKGEEVKAHVSTSADHLLSKLDSLEHQAKAVLPESAHPATDAAVQRARKQVEAVSTNPSRQRTLAIGLGMFVLVLLLRRRSKHRRGN